MLPQDDSFQRQLNDLQRSYANLGKGTSISRQAKKIRRCAGIEEAKAIAKDELFPGDEDTIFDSEKDLFYAISKSNADQTAYLLSVMGKWQANPAATTA